MKIAFWSPFHGTGATSNMLAISLMFSEHKELSKKCLITQTHYNMNNLEKPLLGDVENAGAFFRDTGLDALCRTFKRGDFTESDIDKCAIKVSKNLYLIAGTQAGKKGDLYRSAFESGESKEIIEKSIDLADKFYDIVFVDTNPGQNSQTKGLLERCDVVVVNLRQDGESLEDALDMPVLKDKKVFYLYGSYDSYSKYTLKNIRKMHKELNKYNSGGIPHCTQYMDALTDNKVLKYISANLYADEDHADYEFFQSVYEVAGLIADMADKKGGLR